jgi:hypothetical protein
MKTSKRVSVRSRFHVSISAATFAIVLLLCIAAPGLAREDRAAGAEGGKHAELRARFLAIAEAYATHRWRATEDNVFHGKDPNGTQVDTPDVSFWKDGWHADGRENVGVPYSWGGFCTIEEFDELVKKGAYAGHAHSDGQARASRYTVGVDCSGFVSRCLDLPQKQTSLSMALLCYELESYDELLPGDILNKLDGHVVLFKEFTDASRKTVRYYESGCWRVKETVRKVANLERQGFVPMRYKPLDPRWVHLDYADPAFTVKEDVAAGKWTAGAGGKSGAGKIPVPLVQALPGEWARYDVKQRRFPKERTVTRGVAPADGGEIKLQVISSALGKEMMTEKVYDTDLEALDMIIGFASYDQEFDNVEFSEWNVEKGTYELGGRKFGARRITAGVECTMMLHGKNFPVRFAIECYQSDEVPVEGMLAATYDLEVTWSDERKMTARRSFALREFRAKE